MSLTGSAENTNNLKVLKGKIASLSPYAVDNTLSVEGASADAKAVGDALEKKVNYTDIVDNLTTKDSNKPLSAKQGAELKTAMNTLNGQFDDLVKNTNTAIQDNNTKADNAQTAANNAMTVAQASKDFASGLSSAYNLLDNSAFTNPVNRSRETSWETATTEKTCIDGWTCARGKFDLGEGGLTVIWDGKNSTNAYIKNKISKTIPTGTKLTVAASIGGVVYVGVLTIQQDHGAYNYSEAEDGIKFGVGTAADCYEVLLLSETTAMRTVRWMAAYPGEYTAETIPPYVPKGYRVEALNCNALMFELTAKLLKDGWTEADERFTQELTIAEILASDKPVIDVDLSELDGEAEDNTAEAWSYIRKITTEDGKIKAVFTEKPEVVIPIKIKVVR